MNVTIRKAKFSDYPAILTLIKEFSVFQKMENQVTITLQQMIEEDFFKGYVAETEKKEIVGFTSFYFSYCSWTGKSLYIDDLYVTSAFRDYAIGSKLLNTLIDLAKNLKCKKVHWQVSKWNISAINFYKRMGTHVNDVELNCELKLTNHIPYNVTLQNVACQ